MSKKKVLSSVLVFLLLFSLLSPTAQADKVKIPEPEAPITIQYTYINLASTQLTISSDGMANVFGYVLRTTAGNYLFLTCTLQRLENGIWYDMSTWSTSSTDWSAMISEDYQIVLSGIYRVKTFYYGSGDGGSDSGTIYSKTVTY